jgi:hypothetical protein
VGDGETIARRLRDEHGVAFERWPDRAHTHNHGDLRDTFLVHTSWLLRRSSRDRFAVNTNVGWRWNGHRGREIGLAPETTARQLARAKVLRVELDDNFSGYGVGLWVSAG